MRYKYYDVIPTLYANRNKNNIRKGLISLQEPGPLSLDTFSTLEKPKTGLLTLNFVNTQIFFHGCASDVFRCTLIQKNKTKHERNKKLNCIQPVTVFSLFCSYLLIRAKEKGIYSEYCKPDKLHSDKGRNEIVEVGNCCYVGNVLKISFFKK